MSRTMARITSMTFVPESIDIASAYFRDVSTPAVRRQAGSIGILGAGSSMTNTGLAVSFWETSEDLERSNAEPRVVEALAGYAQWIAGPFKVESYRIVSGDIPSPANGNLVGTNLRTTLVPCSPASLDDVLAEYTKRLDTLRQSSPACFAAFLMAHQIGSQLLMMELWSSAAAAHTWNDSSMLADQRLFRSGRVEQPPTRDILDVFGYF